jgi:predicted Fe-Mo cluster-binding NifX family protein
MIVAIATEGNMVAQHFGRCPEYTLFEMIDDKVSSEKVIPNPGHEPGFLPGYLASLGVSCIIAGGMGPRAQSLFTAENIQTCIGISGPVRDVIEDYRTGNLQHGESSCDHPHGEHNCG